MSELVEHLAELTGFRDRDVLDVTLAGAFRDLLHPRSVAIYRVVGDGDNQRWLTRARLGEGDAVATADPVWVDLDSLPALSSHPARCEALAGRTVVGADGATGLAVFPLATDREVVGVLELVTDGELRAEAQRMVCSILRIYRNFQGLLDYSERDTLTSLLNRKQGLELSERIEGTVGTAYYEHQLAKIEMDQRRYAGAMACLDRALPVFKERGDLPLMVFAVTLQRAEALSFLGRGGESVAMLEAARLLARQLDSPAWDARLHQTAAAAHARLGQYEKAYHEQSENGRRGRATRAACVSRCSTSTISRASTTNSATTPATPC